jgi:NAD(P)-dependent dehydrogenase (short-subunit alcohol dehydrogenase family)
MTAGVPTASLDGMTALVTGAASGIGAAIALAYAGGSGPGFNRR